MKDKTSNPKKGHESQNRSSQVWREESQSFSSTNFDSNELLGRHQRGPGTQPERTTGANGQRKNGCIQISQGRGFDHRTIFGLIKKLASRLELLEQKHVDYIARHRSRLIARLNENEEFDQEVQPEMKSLKDDIAELIDLLGASDHEWESIEESE
jgi:hypothetical protein